MKANTMSIGTIVSLKEPEGKDHSGTIVSIGNGVVRLLLNTGREASYFYSEIM